METLADRIAREGPLNELDAVGWAVRLAKHLETLHAHGVAHGSISPACILVKGSERTAKAILSDVRRTVESRPFHSPERLRDGNLSTADDTWALAATLYVLLTGQPPFGDDEDLLRKILTAGPAPLAVYDAGDDDLQRILNQALATHPAERVVQVSHLREALERWHPDPDVGLLPALEDDDVQDEHEAATAMLPQHAVLKFFEEQTKSGDDVDALFADPDFADPSMPAREEEETVMRELPAHIMAMASRAIEGSSPPPAPAPPRPEAPRPGPRTSADGPPSGVTRVASPQAALGGGMDPPSGITHPAIPRPAAPLPGPEPLVLPDDEDDVSTVMHRAADDDDSLDEGDEVRTVMRDVPVVSMDRPPPPAPPPPPGAFPAPSSPFQGAPPPWAPASAPGGAYPPTRPMFDASASRSPGEQPPTRPQMSSPLHVPPSDFAAPSAPQAPFGGSTGGGFGDTDRPPASIPRSPGFDAIAAELSQLPASRETPVSGPHSQPVGFPVAGGVGAAYPPMSAPDPSRPYDLRSPSLPDSGAGRGSRSIYLVCLVALVVAAALTYGFLRFRHQLGIPF